MRILKISKTWIGSIVLAMLTVLSFQTAVAANNVTVTVVNLNKKAVCSVYLSPSADNLWTGEQLGNEQMAHREKRTFNVPVGTYDLRADYCDGSPNIELFNVNIDVNSIWEVGKRTPANPAHTQPTRDDSDGDGIVDSVDRCPSHRESPNGFDDDDGCPDSLNDLFDFYENDIHEFWQRDADARDKEYVRPTVTHVWDMHESAYYFIPYHQIVIGRSFARVALARLGAHAVVTVFSHEWAHAIQQEYDLIREGQYTISIERQADCLAGAYSRDAEQRGLINADDIEVARRLMLAVGDDEELSWEDDIAHGRPDVRVYNYNTGYSGGVDACLN